MQMGSFTYHFRLANYLKFQWDFCIFAGVDKIWILCISDWILLNCISRSVPSNSSSYVHFLLPRNFLACFFQSTHNWYKSNTINHTKKLTSAAINANVLIPLNKPTNIDMIIMNPDIVKMDDNSAINRKCDHPGVVGENDNCKKRKETR